MHSTLLAYLRVERSTPAGPTDYELWVAGVDGSAPRRIAAGWDRWATSFAGDVDHVAAVSPFRYVKVY